MVTLPHRPQRKHAFLVKKKEKSNSQKQIPEEKISLGILHQTLGHRSTRPLLDGYNANVWKYIEIRVDPDPCCTSCQIYTIEKRLYQRHILKTIYLSNGRSWTPYHPHLQKVTKETNFASYLLIVDADYKI